MSYTFFPYEKPPVGVPEDRLKRVSLIRHAQGTHNLAVMNSGGVDGGLEEEYKNWAWYDARLTELGLQQSAALRPTVEQLMPLDLVFVSPLSRAIQTGLAAIPPGPKFVVEELVRERNGTHPCDKRRPKAELAKDFPSVDFAPLRAEEDDTWQPEREPWAQLVGRATAFLKRVSETPAKNIAVVTHNDFLQALLLEAPELKVSDPALRKKFTNAECMTVWMTWGTEAEAAAGLASPSMSTATESLASARTA